MNKKSIVALLVFAFISLYFVSCDKDYNQLGTNIIGDNHFNSLKYTGATLKAYNQKLGAVATNNLPINPLGFYENPAYGNTQANFVTQLELQYTAPIINNTDPTLYQILPQIDSVVAEVPYFNKLLTANSDGTSTYELDSIYGVNQSKFKLSVYESGYYLRDLDPDQSLGAVQSFYSDKDAEIDANKIGLPLNDSPLTNENTQFFFNPNEHKLTNSDGTFSRTPPSMRLHLNSSYFMNKIINAPAAQLASNTIFKNYFRGLYFKVENPDGNPGNMAQLNFKGGKVTIYYQEDARSTTTPYTFSRVSKSIVLTMTGNSVSLLNYSNENADYLTATNSSQEAQTLYLKGGAGSVAVIDAFGPDLNNNHIADEIEVIQSKGWLINEANLVFYVNKNAMSNVKTIEPNRIFLYDLNNRKTLIDYTYDNASNGLYPKFNKSVFGGILSNLDGTFVNQTKGSDGSITNKGDMYKIRITNHVRNLIKNDSTNVRLGLAITESINNIGFSKLKNPTTTTSYVPTMSVASPLGTIIYGTSPLVPDDKRLRIEIYYTKPN